MSAILGDLTRGTTNPNRLRRVDRWILHAACGMLRKQADPLVVDLGYGATPVTTVELYSRLAKHVRADIEVVGIEIDPERVAAAQPLARLGLNFALGGFEIPTGDRQPALIRASNVLRQYDEEEVVAAWSTMTSRLAPGGMLVEGTCDEIGRRSTWVALASGQRFPDTFTMSLHIDSLEAPSDIAPRLPKCLIHRNVPGEPIYEFLRQFDDAWARSSHLIAFGARQRWVATVEQLAANGLPILDDKSRWRLGEVTVPWSLVAPSAYLDSQPRQQLLLPLQGQGTCPPQ